MLLHGVRQLIRISSNADLARYEEWLKDGVNPDVSHAELRGLIERIKRAETVLKGFIEDPTPETAEAAQRAWEYFTAVPR